MIGLIAIHIDINMYQIYNNIAHGTISIQLPGRFRVQLTGVKPCRFWGLVQLMVRKLVAFRSPQCSKSNGEAMNRPFESIFSSQS